MIGSDLLPKFYPQLRTLRYASDTEVVEEQIRLLQLLRDSIISFDYSKETPTDLIPLKTGSFLVQHLYVIVATIGTAPYNPSQDEQSSFHANYEALLLLLEIFSGILAYLHDNQEYKDLLFDHGLSEICIRKYWRTSQW
jgi:hypothetical protein